MRQWRLLKGRSRTAWWHFGRAAARTTWPASPEAWTRGKAHCVGIRRPFVKRQMNDMVDSEASCQAAQRSSRCASSRSRRKRVKRVRACSARAICFCWCAPNTSMARELACAALSGRRAEAPVGRRCADKRVRSGPDVDPQRGHGHRHVLCHHHRRIRPTSQSHAQSATGSGCPPSATVQEVLLRWSRLQARRHARAWAPLRGHDRDADAHVCR